MYADEEDVMRLKQLLEQFKPTFRIKYVFQNEIVAGVSIRSQRRMESVEESSPIIAPVELSDTKAFKGQDT